MADVLKWGGLHGLREANDWRIVWFGLRDDQYFEASSDNSFERHVKWYCCLLWGFVNKEQRIVKVCHENNFSWIPNKINWFAWYFLPVSYSVSFGADCVSHSFNFQSLIKTNSGSLIFFLMIVSLNSRTTAKWNKVKLLQSFFLIRADFEQGSQWRQRSPDPPIHAALTLPQ